MVQLQVLDRLEAGRRRVVDEVVEPAELLARRVEEAVDVLRRLHVGLHGDRPPAALLDPGDDLLRQVLVDLVVDDDRAALVGQRERQRAADPARAAGDQRDLAGREARLAAISRPPARRSRRGRGRRPRGR